MVLVVNYFFYTPLNAKDIKTIVRALRTTNTNAVCECDGRGFHVI